MYLNTHTYYSLRYGTIKPEALLEIAKYNGIKTFALTDINSTTACLDFVRLADKYNIKPVLGVDFRNGVQQTFVLLAKNNEGFQNINQYLTEILHQKKYTIPAKAPLMDDVFVIYPFSRNTDFKLNKNEFIGIKPDDISQLKFSKIQLPVNKLLIQQTVSFQNKKGFNTHRLLRAIDNNTLLSKLPVSEQGNKNDTMISAEDLHKIYSDYPQIITNTKQLLNRCSITFDF